MTSSQRLALLDLTTAILACVCASTEIRARAEKLRADIARDQLGFLAGL